MSHLPGLIIWKKKILTLEEMLNPNDKLKVEAGGIGMTYKQTAHKV